MFDLILTGGTVIDGRKSRRYVADVAVRGDRIAAIGNLECAETSQRFDIRGKVIAPGFVDVHTHSEGWLLRMPNLWPKTSQGFTTEVLMPDGISYAPLTPHTARDWFYYLKGLDGLRLDEYQGWQTYAEFMSLFDRRTAQNTIGQVPYGNVRTLASGWGPRPVDDFQMLQMQAEIRQGMAAGAVGLSTGLDYPGQCYATTAELAEACRPVAEFGGLYITHMRYKVGHLPALREAVEIGRRSGAKVHISHLKAHTPQLAEEVLDYVDRVARHEVDFSFDIYPYQPGSTLLNYLLPYEIWDDGPIAASAKLRSAEMRARFKAGIELRTKLETAHIAWLPSQENARHIGRTLAEFVAEVGRPAEEALTDLLIDERFAVLLVFNDGADEPMHPFLAHDLQMIGSDGIYQPESHIHPRMFGSAGRMLGPLVRDSKLFSLEEAVYKLSGYPAARFGLRQRGEIQEGFFADLVVFDAATVSDRATFREPHQSTAGIERVFVNGVQIVSDGRPANLAEWPGRGLKYQSAD